MNLSHSTALVTGAASGLGAATALALVEAGATVVGIDLASSIEKTPLTDTPGIQLHAADVTNESEVAAALLSIDTSLPLRVVVNCAGIAPARRILSSRGAHDLQLFQTAIDVNLVGSFNVLRLSAELMARQEALAGGQRGVIVNTASVAAFEGQIGQVAYAASKGGIVAMGIAAARDLARDGIRVMTIAPGIVDTPMLASFSEEVREGLAKDVPFPHRLAKPEEFAQLVLMIAEHDYLNGETIRLDGALRMAPQ
ncbi:SDR family NAD(P)-dependent oxidoreductase [Microbacterium sp. A93]|uniref:SDR family NAD(P)-dependent oxidoreductase n=1 Tax=Microbacterium sp. A93 TaxID=3450716 RepID=UPI003F434110